MTTESIVAIEYLDAGLEPGRTYAYRVTAVDDNGNESEASETVRTEVRIEPCSRGAGRPPREKKASFFSLTPTCGAAGAGAPLRGFGRAQPAKPAACLDSKTADGLHPSMGRPVPAACHEEETSYLDASGTFGRLPT